MEFSKKFFIMLVVVGVITSCAEQNENTQQHGLSTQQYFDLTEYQISVMKASALQGNGDPALRLAQYYSASKNDDENALYWYKTAAGAGNSQGMYGYGVSLKQKGDPDSRNQARHWLTKAKTSGDARVSQMADFQLRQLDKENDATSQSQ
jgi:TPR repeat protein